MGRLRDNSLRTIVALCVLFTCFSHSPSLHAQWTGAERNNAENLTVMIDAYYQGLTIPEWGTGIIVARRDNTLYIATAKHVLSRGRLANIKIALRWLNQRSEDHPGMLSATLARPLSTLDPNTDLAVLKIDLPTDALPSKDALLFSVLADPRLLTVNDNRVRPLGHANGQLWSTCIDSDPITSKSNEGLTFDSNCTAGGDSGGALFDENWRIVGMIVADQHNAFAPSIDGILTLLRRWNIPVDLVRGNAPQVNEFISFSVGSKVACGVTRSNHGYCWGENVHYALGVGTEADISADVGLPVADLHLFSNVSVGSEGACGLTLGNIVLCWGDNSNGQLGNGTTALSARPVAVIGGLKFTSVSSGHSHVCGLTEDGLAYCWGENNRGQLGIGTQSDRSVPTPISSTLRWLQISAGSSATCAISIDHDVYCWGGGPSLILKPDPGDAPAVPQHILGGMKFSQVSVGGGGTLCSHGCDYPETLACGVTTDGAGYCWGSWPANWFSSVPSISAVHVLPTSTFSSIISGYHHACGITQQSEQVYCWGANEWNEAGKTPQGKVRGDSVAAHSISDLLHPKSLGLGEFVSCALQTDSRIFCWGNNDDRPSLLGMGEPGIGRDDTLSGPTFPVRLSRCTGTFLPKPPNQLTYSGLGSLSEKVKEIRQKGRLPSEPAGLESIVDVFHQVDADLQIARGKIQACEISLSDPIISALINLRDIQSKLELVVDELWFGPNPGPLYEKPSAAQKAEMASKRAADAAKMAADVSTFQDLTKKYRDAASVQVLRDLHP